MATNCRTGQCDNMPSAGCPEVPMFSNRNVNYQGRAVGNRQNDAARAIAENAVVATTFFPAMECRRDRHCDDNDATTYNKCVPPQVCAFLPNVKKLERSDNQNLLVSASSNANDQKVVTRNTASDGVTANEYWEEIDRMNGYFSYQKVGTSMSLDGGNGGSNRQSVVLRPTSTTDINQQWSKEHAGGGTVKLVKRGTDFALLGQLNGDVELYRKTANSSRLRWLVEDYLE